MSASNPLVSAKVCTISTALKRNSNFQTMSCKWLEMAMMKTLPAYISISRVQNLWVKFSAKLSIIFKTRLRYPRTEGWGECSWYFNPSEVFKLLNVESVRIYLCRNLLVGFHWQGWPTCPVSPRKARELFYMPNPLNHSSLFLLNGKSSLESWYGRHFGNSKWNASRRQKTFPATKCRDIWDCKIVKPYHVRIEMFENTYRQIIFNFKYSF